MAFFVPCDCHSYNLVLCDAAKSWVKSVTLFGFLQRLFILFSASVNRWKILTGHIELYNLKKLTNTCWGAKINSVKAVRYHEASTLAEQLKDFGFIVSLADWYEILFQIDVVSKSPQSKNVDHGKFTEMLKNCCNFLKEYRKTGFQNGLLIASEVAKKLQIAPAFKPVKRL